MWHHAISCDAQLPDRCDGCQYVFGRTNHAAAVQCQREFSLKHRPMVPACHPSYARVWVGNIITIIIIWFTRNIILLFDSSEILFNYFIHCLFIVFCIESANVSGKYYYKYYYLILRKYDTIILFIGNIILLFYSLYYCIGFTCMIHCISAGVSLFLYWIIQVIIHWDIS